jgi:hypothetical protein
MNPRLQAQFVLCRTAFTLTYHPHFRFISRGKEGNGSRSTDLDGATWIPSLWPELDSCVSISCEPGGRSTRSRPEI